MFSLKIECTKDIDELHINFSDGSTSVIQSKEKSQKNIKEELSTSVKIDKPKKNDKSTQNDKKDLLDLSEDDIIEQSHKIVKKPTISLGERSVSVAPELMDLEI